MKTPKRLQSRPTVTHRSERADVRRKPRFPRLALLFKRRSISERPINFGDTDTGFYLN